MAMRFDNSSNMDKEQVKKILTNVFAQESKRNAAAAGYDKTILGTIQSCIDSTLGQYKIKYQNGYLTAYSNDTTVTYSNGTPVYVTVPENNFNNRLLISALATSDSSAKVYSTFLEDAQRYEQYGPNLILSQPQQTNMSSYAGEFDEHYTVAGTQDYYLYRRVLSSGEANLITLNEQYKKYVQDSGALWIGATFQTSLEESRKASGDYGLILAARYKKDGTKEATEDNITTRTYVLDTFHMTGNPFEYNTPIAQYGIWDIDAKNFIDIDYIKTYVRGFPYSGSTEMQTDIIVSSLVCYASNLLYDTNQNMYKIELVMPEGNTFEKDTPNDATLPVTAILRVNGNPVTLTQEQGIEFWWAKRNHSVDSIGNRKYNTYTGEGWECLNERNAEQYYTEQDIDDLKADPKTTIVTPENEAQVKAFTWKPDTVGSIEIPKEKCKSITTTFKVCIKYNNTIIDREFDINNEKGIYVLIKSSSGTEFYNGSGNTNLLASAFRDEPSSPTPVPVPDITYIWKENITGLVKNIPVTNVEDILKNYSVWSNQEDNENKTDAEVQAYLSQDNNLYCYQRYTYYTQKANYYVDKDKDKQTLCTRRAKETVDYVNNLIAQQYSSTATNNQNWYITGNASMQAVYTDVTIKNVSTADIDLSTVDYHYYGTQEYDSTINNVLYKINISRIFNSGTYTVTAIDSNGDEVGTTSVKITNKAGSSSRYNLVITNGEQTFMYNEDGYAPTTKQGSDNPIYLRPLYFKLYDNEASGDGLIYDSENETSNTNKVSLGGLQVKWKFYKTPSLLNLSKYIGLESCKGSLDIDNYYILENEASLVYDLKEKFERNSVYTSNVELEAVYENERVITSTNFTFLKQGDLGTNGTNLNLDIYQPIYENYRDSVLSSFNEFSYTNGKGKKVIEYATPVQRFLKNMYLYSVEKKDGDDTKAKIYFGQSGDRSSVQGVTSSFLYGQWYNNGKPEDIVAADSVWSIYELANGTTSSGKNIRIENTIMINQDPVTGEPTPESNTTPLPITVITENEEYSRTPMPRDITEGEKNITVTGNNVIKLKSTHRVSEQQDTPRVDYAYYAIPYFYYNATGMDMSIDPTTRFGILGGFDTVNYSVSGALEETTYQPFSIFLRDKNGKDITDELRQKIGTPDVTIEWRCSEGFKRDDRIPISYSELTDEKFKLGTLCVYDGKVYSCTHEHSRPTNLIHISVRDDKNRIIKTYTDKFVYYYNEERPLKETPPLATRKDFESLKTPISDYWELKDGYNNITDVSFKPYNIYNSYAPASLFNSWISVKGSYRQDANNLITFEAFLPINVYCNRYGSKTLNNWDGKSLLYGETPNGKSYMVSNQVAAGVKDDNNAFTGITIGEKMYTDNYNYNNEVGLFGYGNYKNDEDETSYGQTIFMDAKTGRTLLGPSGSTQIILDPDANSWSRLGGWYFNKDYLYKPSMEDIAIETIDITQGKSITPPTDHGERPKSVGIYCPNAGITEADLNKPFIWASGTQNTGYEQTEKSDFYVTHGGKLHAQNAEIVGNITANSGKIGGDADGIQINVWKGTDTAQKHYILYNDNFQVLHDKTIIKGEIVATSGKFGTDVVDASGASSKTVFIAYNWYPWVYNNQGDPVLDTEAGKIEWYPLYHKNFHIKQNGTVFINGELYAKKGKIGGWLIKSNSIESVDYDEDGNGLKLSGNGKLQGPQWYINPDGTSSFGKEAKFSNLCNSAGKTIINEKGNLEIPAGYSMKIGSGELKAWKSGVGFTFTGKGHFDNDIVTDKNVRVNDTITFNPEGDSLLCLNKTGIYFSGKDGYNRIDTSGNAFLESLSINNGKVTISSSGELVCVSLKVGGKTLTQFIQDVINNSVIQNAVNGLPVTITGTTGPAEPNNHSHGYGSLIGEITVSNN